MPIPEKGSQEARDRMQYVRSHRKPKEDVIVKGSGGCISRPRVAPQQTLQQHMRDYIPPQPQSEQERLRTLRLNQYMNQVAPDIIQSRPVQTIARVVSAHIPVGEISSRPASASEDLRIATPVVGKGSDSAKEKMAYVRSHRKPKDKPNPV